VSERLEELTAFPDHSRELAQLVGEPSGDPQLSPHAVNAPMIRHWVEAMGDTNPVYDSNVAAQSYGYERVIAPPTMLQAWIMRGLGATLQLEAARATGGSDVVDPAMTLLEEEGFTSVVATDCEQHYGRPLVIGDRLLVRSIVESISDPKRTGLGTGRFLTTRMEFTAVPDAEVPDAPTRTQIAALAASGEPVATMRFRILKFLPPAPQPQQAPLPPAPQPQQAEPVLETEKPGRTPQRPLRPRPAITPDNAFWFEGARAHTLLIQRCTSCGTLRHPPLPACGKCRSLGWDTLESGGRGTLYSFVVVHFPQVAAFDYPLPIGLVELEEGTRVVANIDGFAPGALRIGQPLRATFVDFDDELSLPVFVAALQDEGGAA
jgi:uncharacterized OB-fold protein